MSLIACLSGAGVINGYLNPSHRRPDGKDQTDATESLREKRNSADTGAAYVAAAILASSITPDPSPSSSSCDSSDSSFFGGGGSFDGGGASGDW